jgi:hypothetical protein
MVPRAQGTEIALAGLRSRWIKPCRWAASSASATVEQRLEQMVVAPIDDGDVDRRRSKCTVSAQTREAAADDHHMVPAHHGN